MNRHYIYILCLIFLVAPIYAESTIDQTRSETPLTNTVEFFQKGKLNDPIMSFDMDPLATRLEQHIYQIREGAPGGYDASGGSCGCN